MAEAKGYDEGKVQTLFKTFEVTDEMEDQKTVEDFKLLDAERTEIYKRDIEGVQDSDVLFSAFAEDDWEHIVRFDGEQLHEVMTECKIMFEPLPPTAMVEYQFEDKVWRLSKIGVDACNHYRQSKFGMWEGMITKPVCEASLRRMYEIGLITTLFDHLAFPNPPEMESQYVAKNEETGKDVIIPHPVLALRTWKRADDNRGGSYVEVQSRLDSCPAPEEEAAYWQKTVDYLKLHFPEEMERIVKGEKKAL